jgi:hypothetical protein
MVNEIAWGGAPRIKGTVNIGSETEFAFEAGTRDSLAIPYTAIVSLTYGTGSGYRGAVLVIPWEVTEQYTKNAHFVLTIVFQDQSGSEQAAVIELGNDLVRPTLSALEHRSGKSITFQSVEACVRFKTREECDFGSPGELQGLTKVFLDARREDRDLILAELNKGDTGLEMLDDSAAAEVLVTFRSERSMNPQCRCEGGRGEVAVAVPARLLELRRGPHGLRGHVRVSTTTPT